MSEDNSATPDPARGRGRGRPRGGAAGGKRGAGRGRGGRGGSAAASGSGAGASDVAEGSGVGGGDGDVGGGASGSKKRKAAPKTKKKNHDDDYDDDDDDDAAEANNAADEDLPAEGSDEEEVAGKGKKKTAGRQPKRAKTSRISLGHATPSQQLVLSQFFEGEGSLENAPPATVASLVGARHVGVVEERIRQEKRRQEAFEAERPLRYAQTMLAALEVQALIDSTAAMSGKPLTEAQVANRQRAAEMYARLEKLRDEEAETQGVDEGTGREEES